ncbi:MAG: hypothetical protein VW258_13780 [Thalassolituus sp.]
MINKNRPDKEKIECLVRVILNIKDHLKYGDPKRMYSQYLRYALDEVSHLNFCYSRNAVGLKRKDLVHEHVVPHSFVMEKLLSLEEVTPEKVKIVLEKFYIICAITKDEDRKLTAAGLRSKMPESWNEYDDSVFARYEAVGIMLGE